VYFADSTCANWDICSGDHNPLPRPKLRRLQWRSKAKQVSKNLAGPQSEIPTATHRERGYHVNLNMFSTAKDKSNNIQAAHCITYICFATGDHS